ncbi:MAG: TIGR04282 family arsenosugar biosynthesis glycosyltransferase [Cyclobacteriaceae bacterium]|nr:TIGR04282 family arsenosugar biosynthesis glycosyltransferase [Cyclobacteriaceae bacterium HetDA_MAG_MS6]
MNKNLLVVFVKNLIPGTVKTRLAEDLGMDVAMEIYKELLAYTAEVADKVKVDKAVYYSQYVEMYDFWNDEVYKKHVQEGKDLGQKMLNALYDGFELEYEKILLIGSDSFEIDKKIIDDAFGMLDEKDFVFGPAHDGGYYLIGMKNVLPALFEGKTYSTSDVLQDAIEEVEDAGLSYGLLPNLHDIDTKEDLKKSGIEIVFEDPDDEQIPEDEDF